MVPGPMPRETLGLLLDLDPHSAYLQKADAEDFNEQTRGAYDGVGLELQQLPEGGLRVIAPLDDSPADRAGLRSGTATYGLLYEVMPFANVLYRVRVRGADLRRYLESEIRRGSASVHMRRMISTPSASWSMRSPIRGNGMP